MRVWIKGENRAARVTGAGAVAELAVVWLEDPDGVHATPYYHHEVRPLTEYELLVHLLADHVPLEVCEERIKGLQYTESPAWSTTPLEHRAWQSVLAEHPRRRTEFVARVLEGG